MRTYASFFQWKDRERAELGVVEELVAALRASGFRDLREPQSFRPDPPDCTCLNESGKSIAVEVSEIVCQDAARLTAKGHHVHREWQEGEFVAHVARQLHEKDDKLYHGGPYEELVICLFTDEMYLWPDRIRQDVSPIIFGPFKQITAAYVLCSYEAASKSYPLIRLHVQNAA